LQNLSTCSYINNNVLLSYDPINVIWNVYHRLAFASNYWEASATENDMCAGGKFKTTMALKRSKKNWHHLQEKGSVRFPLDKPITYELVKKIIRYIAREILGEGK